jgi:hypothetical protein
VSHKGSRSGRKHYRRTRASRIAFFRRELKRLAQSYPIPAQFNRRQRRTTVLEERLLDQDQEFGLNLALLEVEIFSKSK